MNENNIIKDEEKEIKNEEDIIEKEDGKDKIKEEEKQDEKDKNKEGEKKDKIKVFHIKLKKIIRY